MCGIIGFIAGKDRRQQFSNLYDLYVNQKERGRYGAGVCSSNPKTGKIRRVRTYEPNWLFSAYYNNFWGNIRKGDLVLFHHRLPTSTPEGEIFNHPLANETKDLFLIHNGMISNYQYLASTLMVKGHKFESYDGKQLTDSEVLIHLLEDCREESSGIKSMMNRLINRVYGSYAIAFFYKNHDKIYLYSHDNPIIVSKDTNNNFYFSSEFDTKNLYDLTEVRKLESGELGVLSSAGYRKIFKFEDTMVSWWELGDTKRNTQCDGSGFCSSCVKLPSCDWHCADSTRSRNDYEKRRKESMDDDDMKGIKLLFDDRKPRITKRIRKWLHYVMDSLLQSGTGIEEHEDGHLQVDYIEFLTAVIGQIKSNEDTENLPLSDYEVNRKLERLVYGKLMNSGYIIINDGSDDTELARDIIYETIESEEEE